MGGISVIISMYNGADLVGEQLGALTEQSFTGEWELLVVDNGSTDDSVAVTEQWRSKLPMKIVSFPERGLNAARNAGAHAAAGAKLAFLDHDDCADSGWLAAMNSVLDEHRLAGGRLDYGRLNTPFVVETRDQKLAMTELPVYRGSRYAIGCNMGIRRDAFDEIGGFDPTLVAGADEMDFFFRGHQPGIEPAFAPDAVVEYRRQMHRYAIGHAQLDAKCREAGAIPRQSNRSRAAAVWGHLQGLGAANLWFSPAGRWRYAQRAGNAGGRQSAGNATYRARRCFRRSRNGRAPPSDPR